MVSRARFPRVAASAGHYESFYLEACHPQGSLGVWIRYTVLKRRGAPPKGYVWFTLFDEVGVTTSKAELGSPRVGDSEYIVMDGCRFSPGHVVGRAASDRLDAGWELCFKGDEPALWHLPRRWMYRAPVPSTKVLSPHPHVVFGGRIDAGGRRIEVEGWPGMVGHNWGSEHARRTIWIHGANFRDHKEAWVDLAIARVGFGLVTTPWIANGALSLDGRRHRLGGLGRMCSTRIHEAVERCGFLVAGDEVVVKGTVGANRQRFVGWIYAQPNGGARQTVNCGIADLRLEVSRRRAPPVMLELQGGAAYELQMEERYPQIPVQPFPDR